MRTREGIEREKEKKERKEKGLMTMSESMLGRKVVEDNRSVCK